jgi:type I restriction enzyme R subunit
MKDPLDQAISQHLRNQQDDGIRSLYVYAQLLLSIATDSAKYATLATPEKFWAEWHEKFETKEDEENHKNEIVRLRNTPLSEEKKAVLFTERFRYVRSYFDALEKSPITPSKQDSVIFSLCKPERLSWSHIWIYCIRQWREKKLLDINSIFLSRKL